MDVGCFSWVLRRGEVGGLWPSCDGWSGWLGERHGDLLDVLGGCSQQALACDAGETSKAGIAMPVKLLGIGKRALDRLLAALIDCLAPRGQAMGVGALAGVGPDMAGDGTHRLGV